MKKSVRLGLVAFSMVVVGSSVATVDTGRPLQEVFDRSDIVVVAVPIESVQVGPPTNTITGGVSDEVGFGDAEDVFLPMTTRFRIEAVLKGTPNTNVISVFHYCYAPGCWGAISEIALVSFEDDRAEDGKPLGYGDRNRHLLPLRKKTGSNDYVPTIGHAAASDSIFMLANPRLLRWLIRDHAEAKQRSTTGGNRELESTDAERIVRESVTNGVRDVVYHSAVRIECRIPTTEPKVVANAVRTVNDKVRPHGWRCYSRVSSDPVSPGTILDIGKGD